MQNNQCDFIRDQLLTKSPMELKDNSIDLSESDYSKNTYHSSIATHEKLAPPLVVHE
jgi:hypothetical protein